MRDLADAFTKVVASRLHYFDKQDSVDLQTCSAQDILDLQDGWRDRYLNDLAFHSKVDSVVHGLLQEVDQYYRTVGAGLEIER